METLIKTLGSIVLVLLVVMLVSVMCAYPTKWLVNYVLAPQFIYFVFGVTKIGFWKALGTNVLASSLFKSSTTSSK